MERVYLTQEGYDKLAEELEELRTRRRKEISQAIEHARSLGDLKENAEYHAAKEAMAYNEKRIKELEDKLSRAEIIEKGQIATDKAYIGAKLRLKDLKTEEEIEYILVSPEEADPLKDCISVSSPVGKVLLGRSQGEIVEIVVPAGTLKYQIIKITR
ncbi:MAG: transcription elongation factor GreA [Candidatus Omnitrophica bacterium]|jgi:transcription elongation factor GreA|nr:transcription elongation factor GreA [Candidatus Omnitrophota bacterium]